MLDRATSPSLSSSLSASPRDTPDILKNAARILPGRDQIDAGGAVAMPTKAAHLRQETGNRLILRQGRSGPGAGWIVTAEHL